MSSAVTKEDLSRCSEAISKLLGVSTKKILLESYVLLDNISDTTAGSSNLDVLRAVQAMLFCPLLLLLLPFICICNLNEVYRYICSFPFQKTVESLDEILSCIPRVVEDGS